MFEDLLAALQAFRNAEAEVDNRQQALVLARNAVPVAREKLAQEIVKAAQSGARQRDLADLTGYSREQIRRITRAGGVPAPESE